GRPAFAISFSNQEDGMKATMMVGYGGPEVLEFKDVPTPKPRAGEVLVKIAACSVNPIDWRIRKGELKLVVREKLPLILGADISGEVVELGAGVSRLKVGDPV